MNLILATILSLSFALPAMAHQNIESYPNGAEMPQARLWLYKSPDKGQTPSGMVTVTEDGKITFNESLKGLTFDEAQKKWALTAEHDGECKDCKIFQIWGAWSDDRTKKAIYHLDAKFLAGKLSSYRLRGAGISENTQWTDLN